MDAVVGAGSTGVELAGAMGRLLPDILKHRFLHLERSQLRIVLIEPQPHALSAMLKDLGEYADGQLKHLR